MVKFSRESMQLNQEQKEFLESLQGLFWWKLPQELTDNPLRTLAGVMDRGSMVQWRDMENLFDSETIADVLETAKCGEFHGWSWTFWRGRYNLPDKPLPSRLPGMCPPSGEAWNKEFQKRQEKFDYDDPNQRLAWLIKLIQKERSKS